MALTEVNSIGIKNADIVNADIADDTITEAKLDIHAAPSGTNKFLGYTSNGMEWAVPPDTDTTTPADNTVGLAQLAGIARGKIIYGDASGDPALLAVGSNGQVLKSDGTDISWGDSAAGATGAGSDKIFWENGQTVTQNYTITNNYNAMSAGPITINNSVTVTIGDGETWTIV